MASQLAIHRSRSSKADLPSAEGDSFRVVIRMEKVRQNLTKQLGERPTDSAVLSWLGTLGFSPATDGNAWTCDRESLRWLEDGEIVRTEPVDDELASLSDSAGWTMEKLRDQWRVLSVRVQAAVNRFTRTISHP
jgi:hypothetical protein